MKKSLALITFWLLIISFLVVASEFFVPVVREFFRGSILFLVPIIIFFFLGLALVISTIKEKVQGLLKKFLILTGVSAAGFFICIFLHNLIYGLFIYFFGQDFWEKIGLGDEPLFFIIAIFICPIGFLIGIVGSIVLFIKENRVIKN